MKKLICFLAMIMVCGACFAGDIELQQGALFNIEDSEIDYIISKTFYSWEDLNLDVWTLDIDRVLAADKDFTFGLAIAYDLGNISEYIKKIKDIPILDIIDEKVDISIGYSLGVKDLFSRECEWKHGIYTIGAVIKF